MNSYRMRALVLLLFSWAFMKLANGQCHHPVSHLTGTEVVGGTLVTVTSAGYVDTLPSFCANTQPYYVGYDLGMGGSGDGSYTFTFQPSIVSATINVGALSNGTDVSERLRVFVNGTHHVLTNPGVLSPCPGTIAELTAEGDLTACTGCYAGARDSVPIMGPISTLTVQDTVLWGTPGGVLFALTICSDHGSLVPGQSAGPPLFYPNPTGGVLHLTGNGFGGAAHLVDASGRSFSLNAVRTADGAVLDLHEMSPGIYLLRIDRNGGLVHHRVLIQ